LSQHAEPTHATLHPTRTSKRSIPPLTPLTPPTIITTITPGKPLSKEQLIPEIGAFILAGFDTSSHTIAWCL